MANDKDLQTIKQLLDSAESNIRAARNLLFSRELTEKVNKLAADDDSTDSIEGVFDGEFMIGQNKKRYPVHANYASKSKLLPGDVLKLTISENGSFLFKQIGPIRRKQVVGKLESADNNRYFVTLEGNKYRISAASVSYFKAKVNDSLTILIPEDAPSEWAAVENLIEDIN
jgi:hypothetical protein